MYKLFLTIITILSLNLQANESITDREFDCVIIPSKIANLGSNVSGIIKSVRVDRNDFIEKWHTVAVLDNKVEKAMLDLAKLRASLTSDIALSKASYDLALREQKRVQKAYVKGVLTMHDKDVADTDVKLTSLKMTQAQEKKLLADKEFARVDAVFKEHTVNAPFSGVIMDRFKIEGEFVSDEPIVRLAQLNPLHVEVILPISERKKIKKGMMAQVCKSSEPDSQWIAKVTQVDRVMDVASGTFGVRLVLPNKKYSIPAGLQCDLKFINAEAKKSK